jgi:hypothetical protein
MKKMFYALMLLVGFSSCDSGTSMEGNNQSEGSNIHVQSIIYDDLSSEIQGQIEGAGCSFSLVEGGDAILINGLMRINGLNELLNSVELYINDNWEFELTLNGQSDLENFSVMAGTVKLRSRSTNETKTFQVFGSCGC